MKRCIHGFLQALQICPVCYPENMAQEGPRRRPEELCSQYPGARRVRRWRRQKAAQAQEGG